MTANFPVPPLDPRARDAALRRIGTWTTVLALGGVVGTVLAATAAKADTPTTTHPSTTASHRVRHRHDGGTWSPGAASPPLTSTDPGLAPQAISSGS